MKLRKTMLLLFFFTFAWCTFDTVAKIGQIYPAVGLRYAQALTEQQVARVQAYAESRERAVPETPSFWGEAAEDVAAGGKSERCVTVRFLGNAADCFPAEFLTGGYPGDLDPAGCAISSRLAWRLFGSNDIVGQPILLGKQAFLVRGVFRNEESLCLAGADSAAGFHCIELSGTVAADRRSGALNFVAAAGIPPPQRMVYGPDLALLAGWASSLPMAFLMGVVLWEAHKQIRGMPSFPRHALAFAIALAFALALPSLLARIPAWLIPSRWSDFSFWTLLWQTLRQRLEEWFLLPPDWKDGMAKGLFLKLGFCLCGQCLCLQKAYRAFRL